MPNFCTLTIAGHLSQDPELRHTQSGMPVCKCSIAFNRKRDGQDKATFVPLVLFKESAERFAEWFRKGAAVLVHGSLDLEQWEDRETGKPRSKLSMIVDRFENLTPRQKAEPESRPASAPATKGEQAREERRRRDAADYGDIPFMLLIGAMLFPFL